jgi:hypothetical protein
MATQSRAWAPSGGWDGFAGSDEVEELAWEVLASWHYINPTATTSVWESPSGATVYLAFDEAHALIEVVVGAVPEEDFELQVFETRMRALGLSPEG